MDKTTDFEQTQANNATGLNITYSAKYLGCKSSKCLICLTGKGHGPYWYASFSYKGKLHSIFVGDTFKPLDIKAAIARINAEHLKQAKAQQDSAPKQKRQKPARKFGINRAEAFTPESPLVADRYKEPTQSDFNSDISVLSSTRLPQHLKVVYRQLIKKYHPDQYFGNIQMNHWMAEINSTYKEQLLKVRSAG